MHHAIQGFSGAETWGEFNNTLLRSRLIQRCYDSPMKKPCACKICGEIGHTQEEHQNGCPHCEENHPAEECPISQVTCFLCEGTTHYSAQCYLYPKVQQVVKQQKEAMKETLKKKIIEEPVMKENLEDPDGQGLTRFFSNSCYSCGEEGHCSQDCTKESHKYLGNFPTEKVEFDPHEMEELTRTKNSGKKRKYTRKSQISADKDLSHISCFKCKTLGHYANMCPTRKRETRGAKNKHQEALR
uniref:CCHC-type domain-containing protein n=1 Tax=Hordeum vulgare subsp. vulgare TaxID=112509 RepID=A0A8I6WQF9_HORVV